MVRAPAVAGGQRRKRQFASMNFRTDVESSVRVVDVAARALGADEQRGDAEAVADGRPRRSHVVVPAAPVVVGPQERRATAKRAEHQRADERAHEPLAGLRAARRVLAGGRRDDEGDGRQRAGCSVACSTR